MAQSKSDINLDDLKPLSQAEQRLIDCCRVGEMLFLGDVVPNQPTDENSIRSPLIRHLLLGGCDDAPTHAKGVRVMGGYITESLDFGYGETDQALHMAYCNAAEDLIFDDFRIRSIFLTGSEVEGVRAQRAKVEQSIFMRTKFHAKRLVVLRGADIGGQLDCSGGRFDQGLNFNGLTVKTDVFLSDGFHSKEPVDLIGAVIGGQLTCHEGQFDQGLICNAMVVKADVFFEKRIPRERAY